MSEIKERDNRDWFEYNEREVILRIPNDKFVRHSHDASLLEIGETSFWVNINQIVKYRFDGIFFRTTRNFAKRKGLEDFIYIPSVPEFTIEKLVDGYDVTEAELEELYEWQEVRSFREFVEQIQDAVKKLKSCQFNEFRMVGEDDIEIPQGTVTTN